MADKKKISNKKAGERTYLDSEEIRILEELLEEWNGQPDKKSREAFVVASILPKVQQINLEKFGPDNLSKDKSAKVLWERRITAIHVWLKNNKPFKNRAVFRLERQIPVRRVVAKHRRNEIEALVAAGYPNVLKGSREYPGIYQKTLTKYMAEMSRDELKEMEAVRAEWQESGPPLDVQLRAAKKYSRRGIINAHELLQKEMAVNCITFSWFPDPDSGVLGIVCHDYISSLDAKSSGTKLKTFREWNVKGYDRIVVDMMGYAQYIQEHKMSEQDQDTSPKPRPLNYENGPGMLPLLPTEVKGVRGSEVAKSSMEIIRSYFQRHYTLASMDDNARTPWSKIAEDPTKFFDSDCYPVGFHFEDPSRMGKTVKDLLRHLRQRQEILGVNAFHFDHVYKDKAFSLATYPDQAQLAIDAGAEVKEWPIPLKAGSSTTSSAETHDMGSLPTTEQPIQDQKANNMSPITMPVTPTPTPLSQTTPTPTAVTDMTLAPLRLSAHMLPTPSGPPAQAAVPPAAHFGQLQNNGFPMWSMPAGMPFPYAQYLTQDPGSGQFRLDPRLWQTAVGEDSKNGLPEGDPFAHLKNGQNLTRDKLDSVQNPPPFIANAASASASTSAPDPDSAPGPSSDNVSWVKIKPPIFSPASTPSRTPRKRKRLSDVETPMAQMNSRPKRITATPKRYGYTSTKP